MSTKHKLPKFVFFDLDDTLLDDEVSTQTGVDALFQKYSSTLVSDRHQRWDAALQEYYPAFLQGNISVQQLQQSRIRHVLPELTFTDDEALAAFEYFMVNYVEGSTLFPETRVVLTALKAKNIGLGVISNGPNDMQLRKLKAVGLYDEFDVVVTAERAGVGKPDIAIYEFALVEAGKLASECWCVGDNLQNDVLAANSAGLTGVWLDRKGDGSPEYQGRAIASLMTLLE